MDSGPIVTQEAVPVYEGDTTDDLKERVLYDAEFAAYPRAVKWFAEGNVDVTDDGVTVDADEAGDLPARRVASDDRSAELRYGENPHQDAAVYRDNTCEEASVVGAPQLNEGAKALSYNNYNDADGALDIVKEFEEPAAAVIKHTNPAGCATADSVSEAYERALSTDPKSAFGGIVALNRTCDEATAPNNRLVQGSRRRPGLHRRRPRHPPREEESPRPRRGRVGETTERFTEKALTGGRLVQERDLQAPSRDDLEIVTEREPTDEQSVLLFASHTIKHVKSNAILFAEGTETVASARVRSAAWTPSASPR